MQIQIVIAKEPAKKNTTSSKDSSTNKASAWWDKQTKEEKAEYIKAHPNSKYAKQAKYGKKINDKKTKDKKDTHNTKAERAEKGKYKDRDADTARSAKIGHAFKKHLKSFTKGQREFFERGDHQPGSKARRKFGDFIKDKAKGVVKSVKHEIHEWKDAGKGIKKLATGEKISDHEKKAIKAVAIHTALVVGPMALTGGLAGGAAAVSKGIGLHLLEHSALMTAAKVAVFAAESEISESTTESQAIEILVKQMGEAMKTAKISDKAWIDSAKSSRKAQKAD